MQVKERTDDAPTLVEAQPRPASPGAGDRNREAQTFISAGLAAAQRALSNDSQKYLQQRHQKGGQ